MKKSVLFLFMLIVLFISFASAEYFCSDGSEVSSSRREISRYDEKTINSIGIGLLDSREHAVLKKVEVEILADAKEISLVNNSVSLELESGVYTISLINATADSARIQIGSYSKTLNEKETDVIGELYVLVVEADLLNNVPYAKIIAGKERLRLDSKDNPRQTLTFGNNKYGIELISASYGFSIISVSKCETGNFSEKIEPVQEVIINQTINETEEISQIVNETETNQTIANRTEESKEDVGGEKKILKKLWFWLPTAIIILLIIYFLYSKIKKHYSKDLKPQNY